MGCHYAAAKELGRVGWTDAPHREKVSLGTGELGKELKLYAFYLSSSKTSQFEIL